MEETKVDKRTKEYKAAMHNMGEAMANQKVSIPIIQGPAVVPKQADKTALDRLIESGLPVAKAEFHAAVNNADDVPESYLSDKSDKPTRKADMWLTAGGSVLICIQKRKKDGSKFYFGVPAASIKYVHFK